MWDAFGTSTTYEYLQPRCTSSRHLQAKRAQSDLGHSLLRVVRMVLEGGGQICQRSQKMSRSIIWDTNFPKRWSCTAWSPFKAFPVLASSSSCGLGEADIFANPPSWGSAGALTLKRPSRRCSKWKVGPVGAAGSRSFRRYFFRNLFCFRRHKCSKTFEYQLSSSFRVLRLGKTRGHARESRYEIRYFKIHDFYIVLGRNDCFGEGRRTTSHRICIGS